MKFRKKEELKLENQLKALIMKLLAIINLTEGKVL